MKSTSVYKDLMYQDGKPAIKLILDSDFTKEIRIAFKKGQTMKKHQTPYPIVVYIVEGNLDFGITGEVIILKKGDLIALEGGIPHDLKANDDCIVKLTLSKSDAASRVKNVLAS